MRRWARGVLLGAVGIAALLLWAAPASATVEVAGWRTLFAAAVADYAPPSMDSGRMVWADYETGRGGELNLFDVSKGTTSVLLATDIRPMFPRLDGDHVVFQGYTYAGDAVDTAIYLYTLSSHTLKRLSAPDWQGEQFEFSGDAVGWMEQKLSSSGVPMRRIVCHDIATGDTKTLAESVFPDDHIMLLAVNNSWVLWNSYPSLADRNLLAYSTKTGVAYTFEELKRVTPAELDGDLLYYTKAAGAVWQLREHNLSTGYDGLVLENAQQIQGVCVEGERLAYASWDSGGSYVAILDRTSDTTTRVYSPAYRVGNLILRGDLLVWRGERSFYSSTTPGSYLFAYDFSDGVVTRLSRIQSNAHDLDADAGTIAVNESRYRPGYFSSALSLVVRDTMTREGLFPDVPGTHPYWTAIKGLGEIGAVGGFSSEDGVAVFRPDAPLTRGQFAKMVVGALKLPMSGDPLLTLFDLGVIQGDAGGRLNPYGTLTRAQLITLVVRIADKLRPELLADSGIERPSTLGLFDPTHGLNVRRAEWGGLLDGLVGYSNTWNPWRPATRGETAQVLWNLASWEE